METLQELVTRLGLKPSSAELKYGRSHRDGISYVEVFTENGQDVYTTYELKTHRYYIKYEVKN